MRSDPAATVQGRSVPPQGLATLSRLHRVSLAGLFHPAALRGSPFADFLPNVGGACFRKSPGLPAVLRMESGTATGANCPCGRLQGIDRFVRSVQATGCLARAAQTILPWASPPQGSACVGVTARLRATADFQLSAPLVTQGQPMLLAGFIR